MRQVFGIRDGILRRRLVVWVNQEAQTYRLVDGPFLHNINFPRTFIFTLTKSSLPRHQALKHSTQPERSREDRRLRPGQTGHVRRLIGLFILWQSRVYVAWNDFTVIFLANSELDILILLTSIVWERCYMSCWLGCRRIIVGIPMRFMRLCCRRSWRSPLMCHWLLSVRIFWKAFCVKSPNKGLAPSMEWRKSLLIHGLAKISTKNSSISKFNHLQISPQSPKSTLMITPINKKTKKKSNKSRNNKKSSAKNSKKSWKASTTTIEKPMANQEPIKSKTLKTMTKPHALQCSEEEAHPRSDSLKIQAETAKSRTARQKKCIFTWIQKSQS